MATTVGKENEIEGLVTDLIKLEHDAIAAYDATIEKLSDSALKSQVTAFRGDHEQHLSTLQTMSRELGIAAPSSGSVKEWLTTGKVALANLAGDASILKAMKTNEDDTVKAYERAASHPEAIPQSKAFFAAALDDERRHRDWMEHTAAAL